MDFHLTLAMLVENCRQAPSLLSPRELATCAAPSCPSTLPAAPKDRGRTRGDGEDCAVPHCQEATPDCRWDRRGGRPRRPCWVPDGAQGGASGGEAGQGSGARTAAGREKGEEGPGAQRRQGRDAAQRGRGGTLPAARCLDLYRAVVRHLELRCTAEGRLDLRRTDLSSSSTARILRLLLAPPRQCSQLSHSYKHPFLPR